MYAQVMRHKLIETSMLGGKQMSDDQKNSKQSSDTYTPQEPDKSASSSDTSSSKASTNSSNTPKSTDDPRESTKPQMVSRSTASKPQRMYKFAASEAAKSVKEKSRQDKGEETDDEQQK